MSSSSRGVGVVSAASGGGDADDAIRDQDRLLPIANISRIMKRVLPEHAKMSKESKSCIQECVSEFIGFITSEASDRLLIDKRKTITGDDLIEAMRSLGFENYVEFLQLYLKKYRQSLKGGGKPTTSSPSQQQQHQQQQHHSHHSQTTSTTSDSLQSHHSTAASTSSNSGNKRGRKTSHNSTNHQTNTSKSSQPTEDSSDELLDLPESASEGSESEEEDEEEEETATKRKKRNS